MGDESTHLYVLIGEPDAPAFAYWMPLPGYLVVVVDQLLEQGFGLGSEPAIGGVAAVSEGWRHLSDDELRAALPPQTLATMIGADDPEIWAGSAQWFRDRARPRDLPDRLRAEVRSAVGLLRDGTVVQVVRDRRSRQVTASCSTLAVTPDDVLMPHAMQRLLSGPGQVRVADA